MLVAGAVLAPGKRTVSQALRVMGLAERPGFGRYHDVLSRARWNGRAVGRTLLAQVLDGSVKNLGQCACLSRADRPG